MLIQRIPGVFNYCDSWCERCRLQHACEVYHDVRCMEAGLTIERDPPVHEWHDEIDLAPLTPDDLAHHAAELEKRDALTDKHPIARKAQLYYRHVRDWTLAQHPSRRPADPVVHLAWDSIHTLSLTVEVKARRAVHELIDPPDDDPRGVQSDGNGTTKLLRLILRELLDAWRVVAADPDERGVNPAAMMALLQDLDSELATAFPYAMEFVRPGFDE